MLKGYTNMMLCTPEEHARKVIMQLQQLSDVDATAATLNCRTTCLLLRISLFEIDPI